MKSNRNFKKSAIASVMVTLFASSGYAQSISFDQAALQSTTTNTVTGLGVSSDGYTNVNIRQFGAGNKLSSSDNTNSNGPTIDSTGESYTSLSTTQYGDGSVQNAIGIDAYTNGDTRIRINQGQDDQRVSGNNVTIKLGTSNSRSSGNIYIDQYSNKNSALLNLGQTSNFNGTVSVLQQSGDSNQAKLNLVGGNTYKVIQNGKSNDLSISSKGVSGDVNITMGGNGNLSNNNKATLDLGTTNDTQVLINGENNSVTLDWSNAGNESYSRNFTINGSQNTFAATGSGTIQLNNVTIGNDSSNNLNVTANASIYEKTYLNNVTVTGSNGKAEFNNAVISAGGDNSISSIQLNNAFLGLYNTRIDSANITLSNNANVILGNYFTQYGNLAIDSNGGKIAINNMTFSSDSSLTQTNGGTIQMWGAGSVGSVDIYQSGDAHFAKFVSGQGVSTGYISFTQTGSGQKLIDIVNNTEDANLVITQRDNGAHQVAFTNSGFSNVNITQSGNTAQLFNASNLNVRGGSLTVAQYGR